MMFSRLFVCCVIALFGALCCAQQPTQYISLPTSTPTRTSTKTTFLPPSVHFNPTWAPGVVLQPSVTSAWFSAQSSIESTWTAADQYQSLTSAVFSAAPTDVQSSLAMETRSWIWDDIVVQSWYTSAVPTGWQEVVKQQEEMLQKSFDEITGANVSEGTKFGYGERLLGVILGMGVGMMILL